MIMRTLSLIDPIINIKFTNCPFVVVVFLNWRSSALKYPYLAAKYVPNQISIYEAVKSCVFSPNPHLMSLYWVPFQPNLECMH